MQVTVECQLRLREVTCSQPCPTLHFPEPQPELSAVTEVKWGEEKQ